MEVVTNAAATQLGVSQRQVQRLAQNGRVISRVIAGRTVLAGRSLVAVSRSAGRGRHWHDGTVAAAAELLETGATERISGSQRSRLRGRLRTISVSELAYHLLGARVTLWRGTQPATVTQERSNEGLSSTGERFNVMVTRNATALARQTRLLDDPDGETLLVELDTDAPAVMQDIALYAYGDERTSSAAKGRIQARQTILR